MRTILLSLFCAFVLNAQSVEVKKDTVDKYVIDKQVIDKFDGTQLEGKTISKYMIAYKDAGDFVEKTHVIFTGNKTVSINSALIPGGLNGTVSGVTFEGLVLVDGKEVERKELGNIVKTEDIANVNVFKPGSKIAESYGEKGKNGVLMITTKKEKNSSGNVYFIDGKRVDESETHKLSPDKIENMTVKKSDGASVIYIVTKK